MATPDYDSNLTGKAPTAGSSLGMPLDLGIFCGERF